MSAAATVLLCLVPMPHPNRKARRGKHVDIKHVKLIVILLSQWSSIKMTHRANAGPMCFADEGDSEFGLTPHCFILSCLLVRQYLDISMTPVKTRHGSNALLMLDQRLRRWVNINKTSGPCLGHGSSW